MRLTLPRTSRSTSLFTREDERWRRGIARKGFEQRNLRNEMRLFIFPWNSISIPTPSIRAKSLYPHYTVSNWRRVRRLHHLHYQRHLQHRHPKTPAAVPRSFGRRFVRRVGVLWGGRFGGRLAGEGRHFRWLEAVGPLFPSLGRRCSCMARLDWEGASACGPAGACCLIDRLCRLLSLAGALPRFLRLWSSLDAARAPSLLWAMKQPWRRGRGRVLSPS